MKKVFSLLTSLIMVISLLGVMPTMSVGALESGDYEHEILDDGTVEITDYYGSATELTIPSTIGGKTVTSIGDWAFSNCYSLTSITIPDSVTSIGYAAFYSCGSLTSITIPDSVTSIGDDAFWDCYSLKNMYFNGTADDWAKITFGGYYSNPMYYAENEYFNNELITEVVLSDDITTINAYAFAYCESLTSVTIGNGVTSIGEDAFYWCDSLTSVTIGNGVTSIGYAAFYSCGSLTTITIPDSVTSIGDNAFWDCYSLKNMYFNGTADDWAKITFGGYSSNPMYYAENEYFNNELITEVVLSDDITTINAYAFAYCYSLTSITIPDSVTSIGDSAFSDCDSLTSITIPDSVTSIGDLAFWDCYSLKNMYFNGTADDWAKITFGGYYSNPMYYAENEYFNNELITEVVLSDDITTINAYAFAYCESLTSVTIGNGVTSIGEDAFYWCDSLTSITIPDSVTSIGDWAFAGCYSLTSITIGNGVTSIGDYAFWDCYSLTSINVNTNNKYYSSVDGVLFNKNKTELIQYPIGNKRNSYTIPDSVTSIGDSAFSDCDSLTSVTIGNSVTSIGGSAFEYCDSLTSINVNTNNKYYSSVDGVLFNKNKTELIQYPIGNKRNSYTIPDSVTSIGDEAFYGCDSLTSVTIPDSVTSIGDWAFSDCDSLTSITIPDSVTSIGGSAFEYCDSLTSITIPDSVTSIGDLAFYDCDSLTIKCYENSTAHQYAIDNDIAYELLPDETQLEGKVYCQFKDNNTMMRFIAEVDIEDVTNANSGEVTVSYNEEVLEVKSITGAYKSLYAGGQVIKAPEGKCYIISNSITGFASGDVVGVTCTLDNYDIGLSREVIIE